MSYTRVEVVWGDAHATLDSATVEEMRAYVPELTHSVGWLVHQSDEGVTIATDRWPMMEGKAGSPHFIPRGMLIAVIELAPLEQTPYAQSLVNPSD